MAAYIALHPGTDITALSIELGTNSQAAGTRLAKLRDAFGLDREGRELLPVAPDGRIAFTDHVGCDWMLIVADEAGPDCGDELATLFAAFNDICDEHDVEPMPDTVKVMQRFSGLIRRPAPNLRSVS